MPVNVANQLWLGLHGSVAVAWPSLAHHSDIAIISKLNFPLMTLEPERRASLSFSPADKQSKTIERKKLWQLGTQILFEDGRHNGEKFRGRRKWINFPATFTPLSFRRFAYQKGSQDSTKRRKQKKNTQEKCQTSVRTIHISLFTEVNEIAAIKVLTIRQQRWNIYGNINNQQSSFLQNKTYGVHKKSPSTRN